MKLDIFGSPKEGFSAHGESTDESLAACPFCASLNIEVSNTHTPSYNGSCRDCGAQGPSNTFPAKQATATASAVRTQHRRAFGNAVKRWNLRGWSAEGKTLAQLTTESEAYTTLLMNKVQQEYPIGITVRAKLPGSGTWIHAEVMAHSFMEKQPHDIFVRNLATKKTRWVSCHPDHGNQVSIVSVAAIKPTRP